MTERSDVLRHADGVAWVEIDGEVVALDPVRGRLHHIDAVGSVVWRCLDGSGTLGEIVADLAAAFGAPVARVSADVDALVRRLLDDGVLLRAGEHAAVDVRATPPSVPPRPRHLVDPPSS